MDDQATIRAPTNRKRNSARSQRSALEKSLEAGALHDGTIKLPSNVDIQKAMADLELASNSPLPSYDDADKFMTLSNINFDVDAFQTAYEQQKQQETVKQPKVCPVEAQKRKPLPPPPGSNEETKVDIASLIPSSFDPAGGRNRAQTDYSSPPNFLQQTPITPVEYQAYNAETKKLHNNKNRKSVSSSCFESITPQNPSSSRINGGNTPTQNIVQNSGRVPSIAANRPGKRPERHEKPTQAPSKPVMANEANKNLAQCFQQAKQEQPAEYRPIAARATSTPHTNTNIPTVQQNYVPAYLSGLPTKQEIPQQKLQTQQPSVPQIPQRTSQQGYQPTYLSSDMSKPQVHQYGSQGQQPAANENLYTQQASVVVDRKHHTNLPSSVSTPVVTQSPYQQPAVAMLPATEIPPDWEAKQTPDGRVFYLDHTEKKTHWAPPPGWAVRKTSDRRLYFVHHPTQSTHWKLPPKGWDVCKLPDGRLFFVDHVNKKTSWTLPEC